MPHRKYLAGKAKELRKHATLSEAIIWQELSDEQLGVRFYRKVPILDYIVDFYCAKKRLVIEINNNTHEWKASFDKRRIKELEGIGLDVIVYDESYVKQNINWVVDEIFDKINE